MCFEETRQPELVLWMWTPVAGGDDQGGGGGGSGEEAAMSGYVKVQRPGEHRELHTDENLARFSPGESSETLPVLCGFAVFRNGTDPV